MRVNLSTPLACDWQQAAAQARTPRLLQHVSAPLVRFTPIDPPVFPEILLPRTHWVGLRLLGCIPFGRQAIVISYPPTAHGFVMRDAGHSRLVRRWDHTITILPAPGGATYRDRVDIDAGLLTPLVWLFAQVFYRHRQRRWRALVARGFQYRES